MIRGIIFRRLGALLIAKTLTATASVPIIWTQRGEAAGLEMLVFLNGAFPFAVML